MSNHVSRMDDTRLAKIPKMGTHGPGYLDGLDAKPDIDITDQNWAFV